MLLFYCLSCTICTKLFATLGSLRGHLKLHVGDKPLGCSLCQKSFSQAETLQQHFKVNSAETFKVVYSVQNRLLSLAIWRFILELTLEQCSKFEMSVTPCPVLDDTINAYYVCILFFVCYFVWTNLCKTPRVFSDFV